MPAEPWCQPLSGVLLIHARTASQSAGTPFVLVQAGLELVLLLRDSRVLASQS